MLRYTQKWVIHWYFKFWVFTFWNPSPKIKCGVALTKAFFIQIFLHFGQFYFYSSQVCSKWLANWASVTDTLTLNGFTRNAKHGFDSWKLSNLAWNSSSSLTIYCGLQLLLREKHSFSLRSLTCDLDSLSLLSNRADSLVTSVPFKVRKCAELPEHSRSEISFLRTCSIPNLISYIHRIVLSKLFTGCVSSWLWNCMRTETNIFSM